MNHEQGNHSLLTCCCEKHFCLELSDEMQFYSLKHDFDTKAKPKAVAVIVIYFGQVNKIQSCFFFFFCPTGMTFAMSPC